MPILIGEKGQYATIDLAGASGTTPWISLAQPVGSAIRVARTVALWFDWASVVGGPSSFQVSCFLAFVENATALQRRAVKSANLAGSLTGFTVNVINAATNPANSAEYIATMPEDVDQSGLGTFARFFQFDWTDTGFTSGTMNVHLMMID